MSPLKRLEELEAAYPRLRVCSKDILEAYKILQRTYESGGKLVLAGNGGSCADADHIVGELMKGFCLRRQLPDEFVDKMKAIDREAGEYLGEKLQGALPALALYTQPAFSTAWLNDVDGESMLAQALFGYGVEGDCFLAISTSGNSANICYAAVAARAKGMKVIALTGRNGGRLKAIADISIVVPEDETFRIQECHLPVYHCLCLMLEEYFFGETDS